ncbi:MAG: ExbD/TolR family protein [Gammaproteobacteria bacterium]
MNFKESKQDNVEVNLTPLIDVVFLLLIFFMITTTFNRHAELKVDLPEASATPEQQREAPIELVIDAQGRYFINGRPVVNTQPRTLAAALTKAAGDRNEPSMIIRADARTAHQSVVTAMDTAARLGLTRLSIATTKVE